MSSSAFAIPYGISTKGRLNNVAQAVNYPEQVDQFGARIVSQVGMPYGFLALGGVMCTGTWPAAASAAPSATALSAFTLYNPAGSGVNLHIATITTYVSTFTAGTTATAVGLVPFFQVPTSTATTGTSKANGFIGQGNVVQGTQYVSGTTVGAQTTSIRIVASWYNDLAAGDQPGTQKDEVAGAIVVPPGGGFDLCGIGGTVANLTIGCSMAWAEIPV